MIRTGIDVTRFGRVATGVGGAAPVRVPECAGPGRAVEVSNGKRRVGRARGRAENNCRAGGDAGAGPGWRRDGWTESEGVGGGSSRAGGGRTGLRMGGIGGGVERRAGGGLRGLGGPGWALVGLDGPGRVVPTWGGSCRRGRLVRVPTAARSRWSGIRPGRRGGAGARDAGFKTPQGSACNMPGTAPRRIPAPVPASGADSRAAVRPAPGAGRASGAVWSTWLDPITGHRRCGRRSGRAPPGGTGIYRGQRLGRGLPLAWSPCAGGGSGVWAGLGPRGGAGADSDGGRDRDSGSDPDARTGTATGSATGTECAPPAPWARPPALRGGAEMTKATLPT